MCWPQATSRSRTRARVSSSSQLSSSAVMITSQIASVTPASSPRFLDRADRRVIDEGGRQRLRSETASVATVYSTRATRWVRAQPGEVYRALLDPDAVAAWRVPNDMTATIHQFDAREGGQFRISLRPRRAWMRAEPTAPQTFHGHFARLIPDQLVVEAIEFESPDPSMAGVLTITTELREADGGCEVTMTYDDIPDGADRTTDEIALQMALVRLAAWVEDDRHW